MALLCFNKRKEKQPPVADAYVRNREYDDLEDGISDLSLEASHPQQQYMEVVEDYYPCSALELPVRKGEIVQYIQSEGVWTYVRAENGADGYIPRRHCRLLDSSELSQLSEASDVGYYSDHHRNDGVANGFGGHQQRVISASTTNLGHQQQQEYSSIQQQELYKRQYFSEMNLHRDDDDEIRDVGFTQGLSWSSTRSSSNQQQVVLDAGQQNGLYSNGETNNHFNHQTKQKQNKRLAQSNKHQKNKPVCGRKCGENCEHKTVSQRRHHHRHHKNKPLPVDKQQCNPSNKSPLDKYGLHKSSVVSVSSGKSVSFNENSLDHNNNTNQKFNKKKDKSEFVLPNKPCGHPELILIQEYRQKSDTDISMDRGDYAAIINDTKYQDWMYIVNEHGHRGFIPKKCAIKHECKDCPVVENKEGSSKATDNEDDLKSKVVQSATATNNQLPAKQTQEEAEAESIAYTDQDFAAMKQLVVTQDYSGQNLDDLYVCTGEIVHMSATEQSGEKWLWVHSLKLNSSGYIPTEIVKDLESIEKAKV